MSKILFVTHDVSDYGAARSLQEVLKNQTGDFYLLVILPYFKGDPDKKLVSKKFNIGDIISCNILEELVYFYW